VCESYTIFNPTASGCRLAEYPPKCDLTEKVTCLWGDRAKVYVWIFTGVALDVSFGVIILCMGSIIFFVKRRERIMNRRFSFANNPLSQSKHLIKQSREVMVQGLFYVGSFTLVWKKNETNCSSGIVTIFLAITRFLEFSYILLATVHQNEGGI
jgi:hypothetical protein